MKEPGVEPKTPRADDRLGLPEAAGRGARYRTEMRTTVWAQTSLLLVVASIAAFLGPLRHTTTSSATSSANGTAAPGDGAPDLLILDRVVVRCSRKNKPAENVTISKFYGDPDCYHDLGDEAIFYHVGKAGGGTVRETLRRTVRVRTGYLHLMSPRTTRAKRKSVKMLEEGPARTLIVNVRDPVDRFVSAFRWRLAIICAPGDERISGRAGNRGATGNPLKYCRDKDALEGEGKLLREVYRSDPSLLAEALCEDSPTVRDARRHYGEIKHSGVALKRWLDFILSDGDRVTEEGLRTLVVLPMERRGGRTRFEEYVLGAGRFLPERRLDADVVDAIMEERTRAAVGTRESRQHSSVAYFNRSGTAEDAPSSLSRLGECCLARHVEDDYRLIRTMVGGAHPILRTGCEWSSDAGLQASCTADLRSMIRRRAHYLDRSLGSCSSQYGDSALDDS